VRQHVRWGRINLKVLVLLVVVVCAVAVGGYVLHEYRVRSAERRALEEGNAAYESRQFTRAAVQLGQYLGRHPDDLPTLLKYADAQLRRRPQVKSNVEQAVNAFEQILRHQSDTGEAAFRLKAGQVEAARKLTDIYLRMGDGVDALRIAETWYADAPDDPAARENLVKTLIAHQKTQDCDKALELIAQWLAKSPEDAAALRLKAAVLAANKQPKEAREVLHRLLDRYPGDVEGARSLAFLVVNQGGEGDQAEDPERILTLAVQRNPQSPEGRLSRGQLYLLTGKYAQAQADLEEAVRLGGASVSLLLTAGALLAEAGFDDAAASAFGRAADAEPHNPAVYLQPAETMLELGNAQSGAALAARALAAPLGEQRVDVLSLAAELYAAANRPADVRRCLDDLGAVAVDTDTLLYVQGLLAMADGRTFEAIDRFEQAIRYNSRLTRAHLLCGRSLMRADNPRRAVGPLKEYVRLRQEAGKPVAAAQVELARAYFAQGRFDEAARIASEISLTGLSQRTANAVFLTKIELMAQAARPDGARPDPALIKHMIVQLAGLAAQHPQATAIRILHAKLVAWQGDKEAAVKALRDLQSEASDKRAVGVALIDLFAESKQYDQAVAQCAALLNAGGLAKDQTLALNTRLAGLLCEAGRIAEGRKLLDELIGRSEGSARSSLRLLLARLLIRRGETDAATEVLVQAINEDDKDVASRILFLSLNPAEGKGPDRQVVADQIKRIESEAGINWRYAQAIAYLSPARPPSDWKTYEHRNTIETLLTECLFEDPEWELPALALASLYQRTGEAAKAIETYRKAVTANPKNIQAARGLAVLAESMQRWDELEQALALLPADEPLSARLRFVQALRQGNREKAIAFLKDAVSKDKEVKDVVTRVRLSALLREKGEIQEAERYLEEALRVAPDSSEALAARVQLHLARGEFGPALKLCEEAVSRDPRPDRYGLLAQVYESQGDSASAEAAVRKMAALKDSTETAFLTLGRMHSRRGSIDKAVESWREGLSLVPKSYLLRVALAEALLGSGTKERMDEAVRIVDELITERPEDLTVLLLRADYLYGRAPADGEAELDRLERKDRDGAAILRKRMQFAVRSLQAAETRGLGASARAARGRALELADRLLAASPRDIPLLLLKSSLLLTEDPDLAAAAARQALDAEPSNEAAMAAYVRAVISRTPLNSLEAREATRTAQAFLARPDTIRAIDARLAVIDLYLAVLPQDSQYRRQADDLIRQVTELAPQSPAAVVARLRWHAAGAEWDELLAAANTYLRARPDDSVVANAAGLLLLEAGDPKWREASLDIYRNLLTRRPNEAQSYLVLAMALTRLNRGGEACSILEKGLQTLPRNALLLAGLGAARYQVGSYAEAAAAYREALTVEPDNYRVLNDLSYILCEHLQKPAEAELLAGKAIQAGVEDASLWDTWGVILHRIGRREDSRTALERALGNPRLRDSTRQSATFHLGRLMMEMDPARGRELLGRLVSTPPAERLISPADLAEAQALLASKQATQPASGGSSSTQSAGGLPR
jgi:tetratricopeptide (TPR) repeat protein